MTEREPLIGDLKNGEYRMISPPPPSGGVVLQYILRLLDGKEKYILRLIYGSNCAKFSYCIYRALSSDSVFPSSKTGQVFSQIFSLLICFFFVNFCAWIHLAELSALK